jgi:DNA repair photolyase
MLDTLPFSGFGLSSGMAVHPKTLKTFGNPRGRGAAANPANRFELVEIDLDGDWVDEELRDAAEAGEEWSPAGRTRYYRDHTRGIIARNQSPDIGFDASINPYRGCEHGCVYCAAGDTPVLCADGRHRPLEEIKTGDSIIGTVRAGRSRRYVETRVLAHWSTIKPAYRLTLADDTTLVTSGDHRFLTERGWRFVTRDENAPCGRAHLTRSDSLMGTGRFAEQPIVNEDYRRGYLCGLVRGDGDLGSYHSSRPGGTRAELHMSQPARVDDDALQRARGYLQWFAVNTHECELQKVVGARQANERVAAITEIAHWPAAASDDWRKGFLAGIFDAEGQAGHEAMQIADTDAETLGNICAALDRFAFAYRLEPIERAGRKPLTVVRLTGGLAQHLRFLHSVDPAIVRKRCIAGAAVESDADLTVVRVEPLNRAMRLYDITTGTGDFIANGVVSHNCYARPSHAYVDLSPGLDFETRLFYKRGAAARLTEEFRKPGYTCSPITLGANTDPYQPIEREHRVTRSILEVMREFRHPLTVITKSALVARDIDLLSELAADDLVQVMISITSLDPDIKRTLEPRAAGPQARLKALRMLTDAGIRAGVMVAPVIPAITDHEIEHIVAAAAEAGAVQAGFVMLRLPYEVKTLFRAWLDAHYAQRAAHVMSLVRQMRGGRDNDPRFGRRMRGEGPYAELVAQRFRAACRRYGLPRGEQRALRTDLFAPQARSGDQLGLFR